MAQTIQISEFGSLIANRTVAGYTTIPEHTFQSLQRFLLESRGRKNALEFMTVTARRGLGTVITAQNYVGLIAMNDGTTIEILPKIHSVEVEDSDGSLSKKVLLDMLRVLPHTPFKTIQSSSMQTAKLPLLEIFIRKFLDELLVIVKHGLRCDYNRSEANEPFFKGQMVFPQQIRHNYVHQERNYIRYDEFNTNCPENRILKSTLSLLYQRSSSANNRRDIKILLGSFESIPPSDNYDADFAKCSYGRDAKDYRTALLWAKVFLNGQSFTAYTGSDIALALLYPMEILFENYIAHLLKRELDGTLYSVSIQEKKHYLFDDPEKHFSLKPDIVVRRRSDNQIFILDTKWKLLSLYKPNYGISQADMYQMYVYQKRYDAASVTLVYPKSAQLSPEQKITYASKDHAQVHVNFVDLFHIKDSIGILKDTFQA